MELRASVCRLVFSVIAGATLFPVLASASTDNGTLTVGSHVSGLCSGTHPIIMKGYVSGVMGSYSPTGLTGGETLVSVYDEGPTPPCVPAVSELSISGFSSDPGSSWLTSITCNGVENTTPSTYTYSGGQATWNWTTQFGFSSGNYSCSIVHK
jgi:hypothetical protein